jgi:hypothetical protein
MSREAACEKDGLVANLKELLEQFMPINSLGLYRGHVSATGQRHYMNFQVVEPNL